MGRFLAVGILRLAKASHAIIGGERQMFKEYTTPSIDIALDGAQDAIRDARRIIVTLKGRQTIEKEPTVDRAILSVSLTQEETAILGVGVVLIEVTIQTAEGFIMKSETIKTTIEAAIRREIM